MYITRKTINMNKDYILHPNTNWVWNYHSPSYKLTETAYNKDWMYIGIFEWDVIPQLPFDFDIDEKTEIEINSLLLDWYGTDDEDNQLVISTDWTIEDNRPLPDELI